MGAVPVQGSFCPDPLWDPELSWDTEDPDLTQCFQQTVLVYVPTLALLVFGPVTLSRCRNSKSSQVPWSPISIVRMGITASLVVLSLLDLGLYLARYQTEDLSRLIADVVRFADYLGLITLFIICMRCGIVTSGTVFLFFLLSLVAEVVIFRSVLRSVQSSEKMNYESDLIHLARFPLVVAMFFLSCFPDAEPKYPDPTETSERTSPELYSSFLSKMTYSWIGSLTFKGWKNKLGVNDLSDLLFKNSCAGVIPAWDRNWDKMAKKASKKHKKTLSILPVMFKTFGPTFLQSSMLIFLQVLMMVVNPVVIDKMITFSQSNEPLWRGYFYVFIMVAGALGNILCGTGSYFIQALVGFRFKTAITSALYRKSLRLSNSARKQMTVGETTNLMQIDAQAFMDLFSYINWLWGAPLMIAIILYLLWGYLGPSCLAGVGVMLILAPINIVITAGIEKYQVAQMADRDRRTRVMDEILNGIKIIKLYAWEKPFQKKVNAIRSREVASLKKMAYREAVMEFLWMCSPAFITLASFATYLLSDPSHVLDANNAFVSLTLFNLLSIPMNFIPMMLVFLIQARVSLKRINKFMNSEELNFEIVSHDSNVKEVVFLEDGTFAWSKDSKPVLSNVNLKVPEGNLCAIVGQVGAGKSSLLSALLGEMEKKSGMVNTRGAISYVPQQAWIQNGTLESNITFGKVLKKKKYDKVVEACALKPDFDLLPAGDQTEIGEKGINLSGGQKQRISLARAVYSEGDIYMLDDPLSAVDSHVGRHIFDKVIGPEGLLKDKTRILVTHSARYLPQCDKITVLKNGIVSEEGSYKQLLKANGIFAEFLTQYLSNEDGDKGDDHSDLESLAEELEMVVGPRTRQESVASEYEAIMSPRMRKLSSPVSKAPDLTAVKRTSSASRQVSTITERDLNATDEKKATIIEEEEMAEGNVKWSMYVYYIKCVGVFISLLAIFLYLCFEGFVVGNSFWLKLWTDDPKSSTDPKIRNVYLGVYGALSVCQGVFTVAGNIVLNLACLNAAIGIHRDLFARIVRAPMSFFDTTPLGRILNRFAKDIEIIDVTVNMQLRTVIGFLMQMVGTIFTITFVTPLFLAALIPLLIVYYFLQRFYMATGRQLKRIESISRSPVYSHFGETLSGVVSIRAYGAEKRFVKENEQRIDTNQKCYYPNFVASQWFYLRTECMGNLMLVFAALLTIFSRDTLDDGSVGLSLSYAASITESLGFLVKTFSEFETNMVSVERVREYQEVAQEAPLEMPNQDPEPGWPKHGSFKFDNYQTCYREGLELVLKGIDCEINSGEKIGIVGRTGAGKSSLTLALFRLIESAGGNIFIDGEKIGLMGLHRLRSSLTIIPQDPVLFSGSMRMNIVPFEQYSDNEVWKALELAHLYSFVNELPNTLAHEVSEGGENLSIGQRQLVCLARALLRKTKVLILDEATAAVDLETDDLIQATIRSEFSDCTVLTIAHRINTIMDSSRVMVLNAGRIAEFDTPENLLQDPNSSFYGLAKEAGLVN